MHLRVLVQLVAAKQGDEGLDVAEVAEVVVEAHWAGLSIHDVVRHLIRGRVGREGEHDAAIQLRFGFPPVQVEKSGLRFGVGLYAAPSDRKLPQLQARVDQSTRAGVG